MAGTSNRQNRRVANLSRMTILLFAVVFSLFPIYWTINTSLKQADKIVHYPPSFSPNPATVDHYSAVLSRSSIPHNLVNTLVLAGFTITLVLLLGIPGGYAVARYRFRGRNLLLFFLLSTVMIPGVVTLIPQYLMAVSLGLQGTWLVLVLVFSAWQLPLVVWVLKSFFERIPSELEESARLDGCSRIGALRRVVLPLTWPGVAASAILVFIWVWNEFIISLTLTTSDATRPLTVGLYFFIGETGIRWGPLTAGAVIVLAPAIVFFLLLQRHFVEGLTAGATKG